jgi:hypothetical protein
MHLWFGITLALPLAPNSWTVSQLIVSKQEFICMKCWGLQKQEKVLVIPWTWIGDKRHPATNSSLTIILRINQQSVCRKGRILYKTKLLLYVVTALLLQVAIMQGRSLPMGQLGQSEQLAPSPRYIKIC